MNAHLVSDVPVGAFLSGGLDSSAIVAMMAGLQSDPVRTFSIGFNEEEYSELPFAREVAQHFGCHHTEEIVTPEAARDLDDLVFLYDEPFADASALPTMAVSRLAAQHVKVVLSGDGGDELFGGYSRYAHDLQEAKLRNFIPAIIRSLVLKPMASSLAESRLVATSAASENSAAESVVQSGGSVREYRFRMSSCDASTPAESRLLPRRSMVTIPNTRSSPRFSMGTGTR